MKKIDILEKYSPLMENVLLILHDFQNDNPRNYISENDLALIASYLNTSYSSIYGVASFYTMFSLKPRGKHIIRICNSPVCNMVGVSNLLTELKKILKIDFLETTRDELFTLETTECLGQCDRAPVMLIDKTCHGNLTVKKIKTIMQGFKEKNK